MKFSQNDRTYSIFSPLLVLSLLLMGPNPSFSKFQPLNHQSTPLEPPKNAPEPLTQRGRHQFAKLPHIFRFHSTSPRHTERSNQRAPDHPHGGLSAPIIDNIIYEPFPDDGQRMGRKPREHRSSYGSSAVTWWTTTNRSPTQNNINDVITTTPKQNQNKRPRSWLNKSIIKSSS